ncbi:MAG: DegV family protein [Pelolinea sp.]|nr:DegV family protein [Pelolinea sp.]
MTHRIALVTDSTCDIPQGWRKKHEITVLPLTIVFGEEQLLDGVDISAVAFYERLGTDPHHPTTSQPTPNDFTTIFKKVMDAGAEEILCITISSAMSGTMASAVNAAADFPIPVHVMDSRNNSMGLGWQMIAAARAREAGGGMKEMLAAAEQIRDRIVYYISLDTIEYLSKGGRIGDAVKWVDSVLQIKPLITVKRDTGTVGIGMPSRSRKIGLQNLYKTFFKQLDTTKPMHITVLHNNVLVDAEEMAARIKAEYDPAELFIEIVNPILGVHTGPGAVALCGYSE